MKQVFILALAISIIFIIVKFLEYKFIEKEHQNVKYLLRDALIVYISVCAGYYVLEQLPYNEIATQPVIVFTDPPNF
jgi:heme/copper-type cytochrome/quinol oxidase subunit 4